MSDLTWRQVIARRLARSHLLEPAPRTRVVDVVRDVGLIQAQVLSAAEIGLCLRVHGITVADVRHELYQRRSLVKTWSLRGTLHLVPADELGFWAAAARGPKPFWEAREWLVKHDLTPRRTRALFDAIADALDGRCLTRAELAHAAGEERLRSGWGELLGPLALQGRLCYGEPRGANVTFVRADQWIGGRAEVDPADARREVLQRYLRAYGPAKPADFQRWSGFGGDAPRSLFDELAAELEQVRVDGTRTWLLKDDLGGFDREARTIRLLPQYDAYVIGFRPREPILPDLVEMHIKLDPEGRFESVTGMSPLVVDGVVTGFWRRAKGQIEVEHVVPLPRGRKRELQAGVARVHEALS